MPSSWTVLIAVHAVAASYALIFGAVNLLRRTKGGSLHRIVGRIWVVAMYIVVLTSFGIRTIDGGFNWLHALSALTFGTLTAGLWAVRTGNIRAHRSFMTGSYFGLIGAFALARVLEALLYDVSAADPATFVAGAAVLGCAALLSSWLPARRAVRISPTEALRAD